MATRSEAATDRRRDWQEGVATVLLVVAAVATSWSSYQATRWNGEQAAAAGRTNAIRIEASRADSLAEAQTEIDVATFIAWAEADVTGEADSPSTDLLAAWLTDRLKVPAKRFKATSGEGIVQVRLARDGGDVDLHRPDGKVGTL